MGNKKYVLIVSIVGIIVVSLLGTYAWYNWTSSNEQQTPIVFKLGNLAEVTFEKGNDISTNKLGPVLDYNDGQTTTFKIKNTTEGELKATIHLNITKIDNELKQSYVKYKVLKSTDSKSYTELKSGSFDSINVVDNEIVTDNTVSVGETNYKFIIYMDGTVNNNINEISKNITGTLTVEA